MIKLQLRLIIFIAFLSPCGALACSCIMPIVEELWPGADYVFVAEAQTEINWLSRKKRRTFFHLKESFKGNIGKNLSVWTPKDSSLCGVSFQKGKSYIIFANKDWIWFETDLCSIVPYENVDPDFLSSLKAASSPQKLQN